MPGDPVSTSEFVALVPQAVPYPYPVTISIEGLLEETTCSTLLEGLAALWAVASVQLLWGPSVRSTELELSLAWAASVAAVLERDGRWQSHLTVRTTVLGLGEVAHPAVTIRPAERVAAGGC